MADVLAALLLLFSFIVLVARLADMSIDKSSLEYSHFSSIEIDVWALNLSKEIANG